MQWLARFPWSCFRRMAARRCDLCCGCSTGTRWLLQQSVVTSHCYASAMMMQALRAQTAARGEPAQGFRSSQGCGGPGYCLNALKHWWEYVGLDLVRPTMRVRGLFSRSTYRFILENVAATSKLLKVSHIDREDLCHLAHDLNIFFITGKPANAGGTHKCPPVMRMLHIPSLLDRCVKAGLMDEFIFLVRWTVRHVKIVSKRALLLCEVVQQVLILAICTRNVVVSKFYSQMLVASQIKALQLIRRLDSLVLQLRALLPCRLCRLKFSSNSEFCSRLSRPSCVELHLQQLLLQGNAKRLLSTPVFGMRLAFQFIVLLQSNGNMASDGSPEPAHAKLLASSWLTECLRVVSESAGCTDIIKGGGQFPTLAVGASGPSGPDIYVAILLKLRQGWCLAALRSPPARQKSARLSEQSLFLFDHALNSLGELRVNALDLFALKHVDAIKAFLSGHENIMTSEMTSYLASCLMKSHPMVTLYLRFLSW